MGNAQNKEFHEQIEKIREQYQISVKDLENISGQFKALDVNKDSFLDRNEFNKALGMLGMSNSLLTKFLFDAFDTDKNQQIDFKEFLAGMTILTRGSLDDKLQFAFHVFDLDRDGFLSRYEFALIVQSMYKVVETSIHAEKLPNIEPYVDTVFQAFDKDGDGRISFAEYKEGALSQPKMLQGLGLFNLTSGQVPHGAQNSGPSAITFGNEWNLVLLLMTGISKSVANQHELKELAMDDFSKKNTFDIVLPGTTEKASFTEYSPMGFYHIRQRFNIDQEDYAMSLGMEQILGNLLLGKLTSFTSYSSNSRSGSAFYFSADTKYLVKTTSWDEKEVMMKSLSEYYQHVMRHPNTLLPRFYGLYKVEIGGYSNRFLVTENVFDTRLPIHEIYDLKGSTVHRVGKEGSVLKDQDFLNKDVKIELGNLKDEFIKQLKKDVKLLEQLEIMDYSLLIGIHDTKKYEGNTPEKKEEEPVFEELHGSRERSRSRSHSQSMPDFPNSLLYVKPKSIFQNYEGGVRSRNAKGEIGDKIYYLAIIDVLIRYGTKKKAETVSKSIVHKKEEISAVPPNKYASRFIEFINKGCI